MSLRSVPRQGMSPWDCAAMMASLVGVVLKMSKEVAAA